MLKVEVIFKILEVNFGILEEVICPASKSQGWKEGFRKGEEGVRQLGSIPKYPKFFFRTSPLTSLSSIVSVAVSLSRDFSSTRLKHVTMKRNTILSIL